MVSESSSPQSCVECGAATRHYVDRHSMVSFFFFLGFYIYIFFNIRLEHQIVNWTHLIICFLGFSVLIRV